MFGTEFVEIEMFDIEEHLAELEERQRMLPEIAAQIVQNYDDFALLDDGQRETLRQYFDVGVYAMTVASEAGYSIEESIPIALMMQRLNTSLERIEQELPEVDVTVGTRQGVATSYIPAKLTA